MRSDIIASPLFPFFFQARIQAQKKRAPSIRPLRRLSAMPYDRWKAFDDDLCGLISPYRGGNAQHRDRLWRRLSQVLCLSALESMSAKEFGRGIKHLGLDQ